MHRTSLPFLSIALLGASLSLAAQQTAVTGSGTTIRVNSDLVTVDVVVADSKQNPVHQLTAKDFTILEDGKPQQMKLFEEHLEGTPNLLPPMPKLDPGMFTNYTSAPTNGALDILLFDMLNTPTDSQAEVRSQVLQFLKEMQPGRRVAIFSLTSQLNLLQGFTSDPELLRALVKGNKGNGGVSPLMNNPTAGDTTGNGDPMFDLENLTTGGNTPDDEVIRAALQRFEDAVDSYQIQMRQQLTLNALNQLARYMSMLPGRKNLIWFSGSFPLTILPDPNSSNPFDNVTTAQGEFRETVDLLTRSQVAVYPIDANGLMGPQGFDPAQGGLGAGRNVTTLERAKWKEFEQTAGDQSTLNQMALGTGGKAFMNTNGLKDAIEKAMRAGATYYTIAYSPANKKWNGAYRSIQVKVNRPGVTLAYRRGYIADDPEKSLHRTATVEGPKARQYSALRAAMVLGGPEPTELVFMTDVRPTTGSDESTLATENVLEKTLDGPFRRYTVTFIADPHRVKCEATPGDSYRCHMDFLTFVYDANGAVVNTQTDGVTTSLSAAEYDAMEHRLLTYHQQISVPAKGGYTLRIGMRDATTDNVGAVEVPIASVAKLPSVAVQASAVRAPAPAAPPGTK